MNKDDEIPSDQYNRATLALHDLTRMFEELERSLETTRGIHAQEAMRCLNQATIRLEETGMWMGKFLRHAREAGKERKPR